MTKACLVCGVEFEARGRAKTCSPECSRERKREQHRERMNDPAYRERKRECRKDPAYREYQREYRRARVMEEADAQLMALMAYCEKETRHE